MAKDNGRLPEIGQMAKADFLPPRVKELHEGRKNRHNLAIATLIITVLSVGTLLAFRGAESASVRNLTQIQNDAVKILDHQNAYSDMVSLIQESKDLDAAYVVASERNVDWSLLLGRIQASVPAGGSVTNLTFTSPSSENSPVANGTTGTAPVVVVNVTVASPSMRGVEYFLLDARQWPGYENASITALSQKDGVVTVSMQLNFGAAALNPGQSQGIVKIAGVN